MEESWGAKPVVSSHTQLCFHFCTWEPPTPQTPQPSATILSPEDTPARGPKDCRRKGEEGKENEYCPRGPTLRGKKWGWVLWCHRNRAHSLAPHLEYPACLISPTKGM